MCINLANCCQPTCGEHGNYTKDNLPSMCLGTITLQRGQRKKRILPEKSTDPVSNFPRKPTALSLFLYTYLPACLQVVYLSHIRQIIISFVNFSHLKDTEQTALLTRFP